MDTPRCAYCGRELPPYVDGDFTMVHPDLVRVADVYACAEHVDDLLDRMQAEVDVNE